MKWATVGSGFYAIGLPRSARSRLPWGWRSHGLCR